MRRFLNVGWITVCVLALAPALRAHPGHGLLEEGVSHAVASPFHLACLALLGLMLFGAGQVALRYQKVLRLASVTALSAAAVLWVMTGG